MITKIYFFGRADLFVIAITNPAIYRREHDTLYIPGFQPRHFPGRFSDSYKTTTIHDFFEQKFRITARTPSPPCPTNLHQSAIFRQTKRIF
jgi:hypothetical protein